MTPRLHLQEATLARHGRTVLRAMDLRVMPGEVVGLIGPNGAGKSTALHLAAGLLAPSTGTVAIDGDRVEGLGRRAVARRVALLPQDAPPSFELRVAEVVALGRLPHRGRFAPPTPADAHAVRAAMAAADVLPLADHPMGRLSGGERQRAHLARVLAQRASLWLLDEPTAGLDLRHAFALLAAVRTACAQGTAAVVALHDLTLASRFCDRVVLLNSGRVLADGPPSRVLDAATVSRALGVSCRLLIDPVTGARIPMPREETEVPR